jgi:hypothetical protein
MPVAAGVGAPDAEDLAALGTAGRVLVQSLMSRNDLAFGRGLRAASKQDMQKMRWRRYAQPNSPTL